MKRNDEAQAVIADRIANIEAMLSALKNQEEDYEGQWSGAVFVIEYETRKLLENFLAEEPLVDDPGGPAWRS